MLPAPLLPSWPGTPSAATTVDFLYPFPLREKDPDALLHWYTLPESHREPLVYGQVWEKYNAAQSREGLSRVETRSKKKTDAPPIASASAEMICGLEDNAPWVQHGCSMGSVRTRPLRPGMAQRLGRRKENLTIDTKHLDGHSFYYQRGQKSAREVRQRVHVKPSITNPTHSSLTGARTQRRKPIPACVRYAWMDETSMPGVKRIRKNSPYSSTTR